MVYWNKKIERFTNQLDLMDICTFFRQQDDFISACKYFDVDTARYIFQRSRIESALRSYGVCKISIDDFKIQDLVQEKWLNETKKEKQDLLFLLLEAVSVYERFEEVEDYFVNKAKTDVLTKFTHVIKTLDGNMLIDLVFAANFRFKTMPECFNFLNMPKHKRDIIIPQDENSVIFSADFRQFEARTYFDLHPSVKIDFSDINIYSSLARQLKMDETGAKVAIIAYLYGQQNNKLEPTLQRNAFFEEIKDLECYFCPRGCPVLFRNDEGYTRIHTLIQTITQLRLFPKLNLIFDLLTGKLSKFIFPLHDEMVFSINKTEMDLIPKIVSILEDDVYKVKTCIGQNFHSLSPFV